MPAEDNEGGIQISNVKAPESGKRKLARDVEFAVPNSMKPRDDDYSNSARFYQDEALKFQKTMDHYTNIDIAPVRPIIVSGKITGFNWGTSKNLANKAFEDEFYKGTYIRSANAIMRKQMRMYHTLHHLALNATGKQTNTNGKLDKDLDPTFVEIAQLKLDALLSEYGADDICDLSSILANNIVKTQAKMHAIRTISDLDPSFEMSGMMAI